MTNMKVTVCFGCVRVMVPCGTGDIFVRELTEKAVMRYRKATGKSADHWVHVHNLKTTKDEGILDPDDLLSDVVDDREQILALFDEQHHAHNGGDGTSGSSVGTESPELFHGNANLNRDLTEFAENDVEVTADSQVPPGLSMLLVRRGSEPALNNLPNSIEVPEKGKDDLYMGNKRWSTAVGQSTNCETGFNNDEANHVARIEHIGNDNNRLITVIKNSRPPEENNNKIELNDPFKRPFEKHPDNSVPSKRPLDKNVENKLKTELLRSVGEGTSAFSRFGRDGSSRQSVLGNHPAMDVWADAAKRQEERMFAQQTDRKEPVGGSHSDPDEHSKDEEEQNREKTDLAIDEAMESLLDTNYIIMKNEKGPLGIHVVPYYDKEGREMGLYLQGIEPGGKVDRDGRLHVRDTVIEINDSKLHGLSFQEAQRVFRDALSDPELRLRVIRNMSPSVSKKTVKKTAITRLPSSGRMDGTEVSSTPQKLAQAGIDVSPTAESSSNKLTRVISNQDFMHPTNTRKIGRKLRIQLQKGPMGLGFSVTTRDNLAGGNAPIYIKNILPKGAAIEDGRLKSGDRLLEVNGIEMTGKTQSQAVQILRQTKLGSVVDLVVSRQEVFDPTLPRELPAEKVGEDVLATPGLQKEILTFDIPVNDTGSAGLGVSVKGKTTSTPSGLKDLGIFVKSVIHGGAAHKDGRLFMNDQLLCVNRQGLLGKTNDQAMATLRKAMQTQGDVPHVINVVVARRIQPLDSTKSNASTEENETEYLAITKADVVEDAAEPESTINAQAQHRNLPDVTSKPVIDKLTGNQRMYNESYYRATHESMMNTTATPGTSGKMPPFGGRLVLPSPVISANDSVNVNQYLATTREEQLARHSRQASDSAAVLESRTAKPSGGAIIQSFDDIVVKAPEPPEWLKQWKDDSVINEMDPEKLFDREGFGRQSMSEKSGPNKMDAKNTDTYQRNKRLREEREREKQRLKEQLLAGEAPEGKRRSMTRAGSVESLLNRSGEHSVVNKQSAKKNEYGPNLGLKKSSSLESLQAAVHELAREEDKMDPGSNYPRPQVKVVRGRGCNESFRAAVDRSYENAIEEGIVLDPLREDLEAIRLRSNSTASAPGSQKFAVDIGTVSGTDSRRKKKKEKEKRKSILKGLGSMFRVGRHKKDEEEEVENTAPRDILEMDAELQRQENLRLQERYRRLQEGDQQYRSDSPVRQPITPSRGTHLTNLRLEHQRRHQERKGHYPGEENQDRYEEQKQKHNADVLRQYQLHQQRNTPAYRSDRGMARQSPGYYGSYNRRVDHVRHVDGHRERVNSAFSDMSPARSAHHHQSGNRPPNRGDFSQHPQYHQHPTPPIVDEDYYQSPRPQPLSPYSTQYPGTTTKHFGALPEHNSQSNMKREHVNANQYLGPIDYTRPPQERLGGVIYDRRPPSASNHRLKDHTTHDRQVHQADGSDAQRGRFIMYTRPSYDTVDNKRQGYSRYPIDVRRVGNHENHVMSS